MPLTPNMVHQRFHPSQDPPAWFRQYALSMGWDTNSGININPDTAMRVTAALACIRIIADTEASLPFFTYRRLTRGKEKARDHYLYSVLHDEANPEMSAFTFRRTMTAQVASRGNGLAEIEFNGAGQVKALWPLNADKVELIREKRSKKLVYMVTLPDGEKKPLFADRVLHIKWLSQNGLWAESPVQLSRESFGISMAAQEFMARFFSNDASPRGALETDQALSDKAFSRLKEEFIDNHGGLDKKHRFAILEEGLKFNPISLSPQDIMLLDLMRFGVEDIGRIYGISSDMINLPGTATYASVEQFDIRFTKHTVRPWTTNWDQECNRSLLTKAERKEYFTQHDLNDLLRGDYATRTAGYNSGITTGWMTRNEAREFENLNPLDGLDDPLVQLNMSAAKQQRAIMQPIYQDILLRVRRREMHDMESAEKRFKQVPSAFDEWRHSFYNDDHRKFVALQLAPALKAHAALRHEPLIGTEIDALAEELADKYCGEALQGGNPDLLRDWIKKLSERSEV